MWEAGGKRAAAERGVRAGSPGLLSGPVSTRALVSAVSCSVPGSRPPASGGPAREAPAKWLLLSIFLPPRG